jgi:excisionase family DNA binding protein
MTEPPRRGGRRPAAPDEGVLPLPEHLAAKDPVPPAPPPDREVFDAWECAGFLGVSVQVVRREWRQGRLPGRKVGRGLRFLRSGVEDYLRTGGPEPGDTDDDEE